MVTLIHQNNAGTTPTQADLQSWVDTYGISHVVVADAGRDVMDRFNSGQPRYTLLGPGAVVSVQSAYSISDAQIEAVLPLP